MSLEIRQQLARGDFQLEVEACLPARGVTAIFGPSGCGKTTLLRAIAGLEPRVRGRVKLGDETWQDEGHFLPPHRRPLGYVFQHAVLFPHLTVRGNLDFARRRSAGGLGPGFDEVVELAGIGHLLQRATQNLSGGERQRVALARALLTAPRLLLLDEPLAALDRQAKAELMPCLERLHESLSIPVLYVSHAIDEVARLADQLLLLAGGRVEASGPLVEMLTRLDLAPAGSEEALAVIEATVNAIDTDYHLTRLTFAGGGEGRELWLPGDSLPVGRKVRLAVHARDVSLTLQPPTQSSILNIIPVRVDALSPSGPAQVMVRLCAGDVPLLARVTRKSEAALGLHVGQALFAQVKSVSLVE